jgi:hypothetical protein
MRLRHCASALAAAAALAASTASAAPAAKPAAKDPPLASWLVTPKSDAALRQLGEQFEVGHKQGDRYEVIAPVARAAAVQALAKDAKLVDPDLTATVDAALAAMDEKDAAAYHSLAQVNQWMQDLAAQHPDLARVETYGTSGNGKTLYVLKLSDNVQTDEDEPEIMITAATHGDELITTEVLMTLIQELVDGHGTDPRLSAMVDDHELFFVPVVNPDGFSTHDRYSNGVDPNRDYPYPERPTRDSNECISALINFFHAHPFAGSLDFHAFGGFVMYPWGYTEDAPDAGDIEAFDTLGHAMAEGNDYTVGEISRVMYIAKGSSCDYYYWKTRSFSMATEISDNKVPPASRIPRVVDEAREMTWRFIEHFAPTAQSGGDTH